jgi:hypothetical protein
MCVCGQYGTDYAPGFKWGEVHPSELFEAPVFKKYADGASVVLHCSVCVCVDEDMFVNIHTHRQGQNLQAPARGGPWLRLTRALAGL